MSDQADQLRQLVRQAVQSRPALEPGAPIVVLSGGSKGVGTTTLTVQLSRELARLGKRTVLVDAHLEKPQLATRLETGAHGCLSDVLDGRRSIAEVLQLVGEGISLLPCLPATDTMPNLNQAAVSRLLGGLRSMGAQADIVLVDAGHGTSPWVQRWWRAAQQVFLIATPEEDAVRDSYVAVKHAPWGDIDGRLRLVLNQCDDRQEAERITNRFSHTCRRFLGLHINGAPPVTCVPHNDGDETTAAGADVAFCHSVRLLATEIVSHSVVIGGRVPRSQPTAAGRLADMIAVDEKRPESANQTQTITHK